MVVTEKIHDEVENFINENFGLESLEIEPNFSTEKELYFKDKGVDLVNMKQVLKSTFNGFDFHITQISGIIAVLIEG